MATLYMVVEHFEGGDAAPIYDRFRARGRLAPDGLAYVASWVDLERGCCFQLMETADPRLIDEWTAQWHDLVDFEVHPVVTSAEAAARAARVPDARPPTRHDRPVVVRPRHAYLLLCILVRSSRIPRSCRSSGRTVSTSGRSSRSCSARRSAPSSAST